MNAPELIPEEVSRWERWLKMLRHPLRVFALAVASACLAFSIAPGGAWWAVLPGTALGWWWGEHYAKRDYRLAVLVAMSGLIALLGGMVSSWMVGTESLAFLLGPGSTLRVASLIKFLAWSVGLIGGLRVLAKRWSGAIAFEVIFVVIAVSTLFAAHRDGVIARPLWLSDWAWRAGADPASILLAVGGGAAGTMALLMVFEQRGKVGFATLLMLPLLALGIASCLEVTDLPEPQPDDGIGLTDQETGEEPLPMDAGRGHDAGESADGDNGASGDSGTTDGGSGMSADGGPGDGGAGVEPNGDGSPGGGSDGGLDGSAGQSPDGGLGGDDGGQGGEGEVDGGGGSGEPDAGGDGGGSSELDGGSRDGGGEDGGDASEPTPPQNPRDAGEGPDESDEARQSDTPPETDDPRPSPPVAVVIFEDDYQPPMGSYYLRQNALSEWNGTRLVPTEIEGADLDYLRQFPTQVAEVAAPPAEHRVEVRTKVALVIGHDEPFGLEAPIRFTPVQNPNPDRFHSAYRVVSLAQAIQPDALIGFSAGNPEWSEELRELYLRPHPDERFAEWARAAVAGLPPNLADDPFAQAVAIKLRMDEELTYSTRERHADAADPTVDFFFGNKIGYCVHFAHAAVFLWRSLGIPARAATGYAVDGATRGQGSSLMVTGDRAHMWPELYLEGVGWVIVDISPEENLDPPGVPPDEELQRTLGEMAREEPEEPENGTARPPDEPLKNFSDWFWPLALFFLLSGLLILYGIKLIRRAGPSLASDAAYPRAAFRACLDRLVDAGLERKFGESREEFAARVEERVPSFKIMTSAHIAEALGHPEARDPSGLSVSRWRELMGSFGRELRASTKWWRRWLGALHPASFIDSR